MNHPASYHIAPVTDRSAFSRSLQERALYSFSLQFPDYHMSLSLIMDPIW